MERSLPITLPVSRLPPQVEETFGPVPAPLYAVRQFEEGHSARARAVRFPPLSLTRPQLVVGTDVFFVAGRSTFIEDVGKLRVKGYDASGQDDAEVEVEEEFSDDEKAR